jgi:hypothetical protein
MAHRTGHSGQLGLTKRSSVQDGGKTRKTRKIQEKEQNRIGQPRRRGKRDRNSRPYKNTTTKTKKKGQRERATESNKQTSKQSKAQKGQ